MPSTVEPDCPCCQKAGREFQNAISGMSFEDIQKMDKSKLHDFYHCEFCWWKFHHGDRDEDFMTREQLERQGKHDEVSENGFDYQWR